MRQSLSAAAHGADTFSVPSECSSCTCSESNHHILPQATPFSLWADPSLAFPHHPPFNLPMISPEGRDTAGHSIPHPHLPLQLLVFLLSFAPTFFPLGLPKHTNPSGGPILLSPVITMLLKCQLLSVDPISAVPNGKFLLAETRSHNSINLFPSLPQGLWLWPGWSQAGQGWI